MVRQGIAKPINKSAIPYFTVMLKTLKPTVRLQRTTEVRLTYPAFYHKSFSLLSKCGKQQTSPPCKFAVRIVGALPYQNKALKMVPACWIACEGRDTGQRHESIKQKEWKHTQQQTTRAQKATKRLFEPGTFICVWKKFSIYVSVNFWRL